MLSPSSSCLMNEEMLIDEEILQTAILEQSSQDQVAVKAEDIQFNEVLKLSVEYRNILMIDHLWDFTSLEKLNLNNNLIEKIEGLDHLINLTQLNLSFNSIEKIEGLESLQKLEVLNLSNNRISVIENMDTLENLTHFILADNHVGQMDNVLYLKKFKKLFSINLSGCPVSKEDDYRFAIAGYFPKLVFLDNRLLDEKTKNEASIKFRYVLEKMKREELVMQQAEEAERCQKAEVQLHTDAFVENLNGTQLFESMLKDDPEAETLHCVPELAYQLQTFEDQMVILCMQLFEIGLAEHKQRVTEVNSFFSGQNRAVTVHQQKAMHILAQFEQRHKERIVELSQLSDPELLKVKMNLCKDEMNQLSESLMALEFELVSQLEDVITKFDINISEMISNFCETALGIFAQCRDLEDNNHEKMVVIAGNLAKNLNEDMPDHIKMLFSDKDRVMDALAASHDNHLQKINDRETQLVTRVDAWKVALVKGIQDKELKRNRVCISDIHRYADNLWEQLAELQ